jgi:hypothetical protein
VKVIHFELARKVEVLQRPLLALVVCSLPLSWALFLEQGSSHRPSGRLRLQQFTSTVTPQTTRRATPTSSPVPQTAYLKIFLPFFQAHPCKRSCSCYGCFEHKILMPAATPARKQGMSPYQDNDTLENASPRLLESLSPLRAEANPYRGRGHHSQLTGYVPHALNRVMADPPVHASPKQAARPSIHDRLGLGPGLTEVLLCLMQISTRLMVLPSLSLIPSWRVMVHHPLGALWLAWRALLPHHLYPQLLLLYLSITIMLLNLLRMGCSMSPVQLGAPGTIPTVNQVLNTLTQTLQPS